MVTLEQADIGPSEVAVDPEKIGTGLKVRTGHARLEAGEGEASSPEPMDEGPEQHAGTACVLLEAHTHPEDKVP